jgi:hypothetical protein
VEDLFFAEYGPWAECLDDFAIDNPFVFTELRMKMESEGRSFRTMPPFSTFLNVMDLAILFRTGREMVSPNNHVCSNASWFSNSLIISASNPFFRMKQKYESCVSCRART